MWHESYMLSWSVRFLQDVQSLPGVPGQGRHSEPALQLPERQRGGRGFIAQVEPWPEGFQYGAPLAGCPLTRRCPVWPAGSHCSTGGPGGGAARDTMFLVAHLFGGDKVQGELLEALFSERLRKRGK